MSGGAPIRPRALVHRGRWPAAGILLDERLLGADGVRRRALALWEPGARLLAIDGGVVVRFPRARALDAAGAPGHLLVEADGVLLATPLSPAERAALAAAPGAVVVVRGGVAVALATAAVDSAGWLALAPAIAAVAPLGDPPPAPAAPPPPPALDVRRALAIGAPAEGAGAAGAALRAVLAGGRGRGPGGGLRARVAALLAGLRRGATRGLAMRAGPQPLALRAVVRIAALLREELSILAAGLGARPARRAQPSRPGTLAARSAPSTPLGRALRRLAFRLAIATRLARVAGLRQGAYVGRLLRMLERGDLDDALRHAIPLGGPDDRREPPALGVPRPRASFAIAPGAALRPGGLALGPAIHEELRRLYRRTFEALSAQGRHAEAAFVLAELLRADAEAVSYLERQGQLRLAAELAEGRDLAPALVVRQWFLARDVERAVRIARTRRAFAGAVDGLERGGRRAEAASLRVLWAEDLAEAGDLEAAVRVATPVEAARALVARWIPSRWPRAARPGTRSSARGSRSRPSGSRKIRDRVLEVALDGSADGPALRAAVVRGLASTRHETTGPLARPLLRALLRDRAEGLARDGAVRTLTALAGDGVLQADLPPAPPRPAGAALRVELRADDAGARPVLDAAVLPGGRVLAALGEAGVVLLAPDGRTVARFDVPAHALVVSPTGARALAVARRGEAARVSRLDLDRRTAAPVRDLALGAFAPAFDGTVWFVAKDDAVLALDALSGDLRTLWRVGGLPGPAGLLRASEDRLSFLVAPEDGPPEGWLYELPGLALRSRVPLPAPDGGDVIARGALDGDRWHAVVIGERGPMLVALTGGAGAGHPLPGLEAVVALERSAGAVVVAVRSAEGVEILALEPGSLQLVAHVTLRGATRAAVRVDGAGLTLADDRGRLLGVDLPARRVGQDLRT